MRACFQDAHGCLGGLTNRLVERDGVFRHAGSTKLNVPPCHCKATRPQQSGCLRERAEGGCADERGRANREGEYAEPEQHMKVGESG